MGLGKLADAERELVRARELRQAVEPRLDTVHTLIQLARVRVARGRLTLAGSTLGSAYEQLSAFDDAGRLPEMAAKVDQALTDALAGNEAAVEPPTPAELSILQLLGSDMSQREIGERTVSVAEHGQDTFAQPVCQAGCPLPRGGRAEGLHARPDRPPVIGELARP